MDMSPVTNCTTPSLAQKVVILFLLFYLPVFLATGVGRRNRPSLRAVSLVFGLTPLFASLCGTWLLVARVAQGVAIGGGGRNSTAAGLAEANVALALGAAVAALASVIALFSGYREERVARVSRLSVCCQAALILLAAALVAGDGLLSMRVIAPGRYPLESFVTEALIAAGTAAAATLTSLLWLTYGRIRDVQMHGSMARLVAGCSLVGAGLTLSMACFLARALWRVALFR